MRAQNDLGARREPDMAVQTLGGWFVAEKDGILGSQAMSVAVWVGSKRFEIGSASFLKSWFSTIYRRLERGEWGSAYQTVMRDFYSGVVPRERVSGGLAELENIRKGLAAFPPDQVVWDFENPGAQPPWGDRISSHITSLANYYVTSDGKDLFEVLTKAFTEAARTGQDVKIG